MAVSRVQKFKEYRNSLIKEETPVLETPKSSTNIEIKNDHLDTTSTLPMDQVINSLNNADEESLFIKKQKRIRILKIVLISVGVAIVIAGIIVFGILVWRK